MKNLWLFLVLVGLSFPAISQKTFSIGKFTVKKINMSLGFETDMINNMDYSYFVNQLPSNEQATLASFDFSPNHLYGGVCENPSINLGLSLTHPKLKNFEWRNEVAYKANRVDAITYYNHSDYSGDYVTFNGTHTEWGVESALLYRASIYNTFNIYGGLGTNLGFTTSNKTCVFTSLDLKADDINFRNVDEINDIISSEEYTYYNNCFDTGVQINQRVFGQIGASIQFFNKIEFGLDIKTGYGYRADIGNSITKTNITSGNLSMRYILNDRPENYISKEF